MKQIVFGKKFCLFKERNWILAQDFLTASSIEQIRQHRSIKTALFRSPFTNGSFTPEIYYAISTTITIAILFCEMNKNRNGNHKKNY